MKAIKKWEVKTGKNRGYYLAVTPKQAEKFFPRWGRLDNSYWSTLCLKRRHSIPEQLDILTHSNWARWAMKKEYDKVACV